jgi:hypothetical protein
VVKVQVPVAQLSVALLNAQAVLHAPQCVSELSGVSQPLFALASQSPKPGLQATFTQLPEAQLATALARSHSVPHAPQLLAVFVGVSQPLAAFMSQLAKPVLQVPSVQEPLAHEAAALTRLQTEPQAPQLAVVWSEISQPLLGLPSQLAKLTSQVPTAQLADEQLAVALGNRPFTSPQRALQAAQCDNVLKLCSQLTPSLSQSALPLGHATSEQTPPEQVRESLTPHCTPHAPQLLSVLSWVSQPSAALLLHAP